MSSKFIIIMFIKFIKKIMLKIAVIDYGMGNLKSVTNAINYLGYNVFSSNNPNQISTADAIVLPGVGAFNKAIKNLRDLKLDVLIKNLVTIKRKPLLGICLGMQILGNDSNEGGMSKGLGLIPGHVRKIPIEEDFQLPHIGWNNIKIKKQDPIFKDIASGVYFNLKRKHRNYISKMVSLV